MPTTAMETEVIEDVVRTACRAPSLHNSQPWQWVFNRRQLRLFLDPSRVMDTDQSAREALISCGAALDHLRVAMAAAGWQSQIDRFPNPDSPNHLASIEFTPLEFLTDRGIGGAPAPSQSATPTGCRSAHQQTGNPSNPWWPAASRPGSRTSGGHRRRSTAIRLEDSNRGVVTSYDTRYHNELHWWTAPFEASEGIPEQCPRLGSRG